MPSIQRDTIDSLRRDLEEEHPGQLANALRVAIDAIVLSHYVLNGLNGAA
jgi:hypothetical protein